MQVSTGDWDRDYYREGFICEASEEELYMRAPGIAGVLGMLPPMVEHHGFGLSVQARSDGIGQMFGAVAFVVDGGKALPLAECLSAGCVHGAWS